MFDMAEKALPHKTDYSPAVRSGVQAPKKDRPKQTKAQRIIALAKKHTPPKKISEITGISRSSVRATLAQARRAGKLTTWFNPPYVRAELVDLSMNMRVEPEVYAELRKAAKQRGMKLSVLLPKLLVAVAKGKLVDAVLDDKE